MFNRNASREQAAPRRFAPYVALIPVCLGVFVAADDQTVVVTVLPQIMTYMKVDVVKEVDQASWIITGYLLGYVAAMPLIGRVSDVVGHRRAYIACTVLFMAGSTAVALTTELSWLVAMRVLQAVGAGALVPISIAIVGDLFPPDRRGLPLGIVGGAAEAGGVIGPLWGGLIARYLEWQWIFWVNIPLSLLTIALLLWLVRPSPLFPGRIDYVGGALLAVALGAVTLGLARIGSPDTLMTAYLGASAAALVLFVLRQGRTDSPLIPLAIFRRAAISAAKHFAPLRRRRAHNRHDYRAPDGEHRAAVDAVGGRAAADAHDGGDAVRSRARRRYVRAIRLPRSNGGRAGVLRARLLADERLGN